jgi:hypothetical protein
MASLWETSFGKPERNYQQSRYNPQIQKGLDQLINHGIGQQQKGNMFDFSPIEQQVRKDYQTKTLPTIANRYLSGSNARNSGGLNAANAAAGKDLELGLAQLRNQFGQQQFGNLMQLLGQGGQENIHRPETFGLTGELVKEIPHAVGAYFGGRNYGMKFGGGSEGANTDESGAVKTEGGPTGSEQEALLQKFMEFVQNYSNQSSQGQSDMPGQGQYPEQGGGLTQIQQLIRNLGTPSGQFGNRNVVYNQRLLGGY